MSIGHLSTDEFFTRLAELFEGRRKCDHGSVFLTQKRLTREERSNSPHNITMANIHSDPQPLELLPILIRATDGRSKGQKIKISTIIEAGMLDSFFSRYAEVCKIGMSGLKKRDRSKGKKKKAKKRKGGAVSNGMDDSRKS